MGVPNLKPYKESLIGAALFGFLGARSGAGFLLALAAFFLVPWVLYGLLVIWRKPERRQIQLGKISIWLLVVVIVGGVQWSRHAAARQDAERVAHAVLRYSQERGAWPAQLSDAGVDEAPLKKRWMLGYDLRERGQPFLFYANTFSPFQPYVYDFDTREWDLRPD